MRKVVVKKKFLVAGLAVLVIGGGTAVFWSRRTARTVMAENTSVMEVQAETGTISNSVVGTGNLESSGASSVTIPSGVEVREVKAEVGDTVSEGDVLATVSLTSVYRTMEEIQETIEELDETIEELDPSTETVTVTGKVGGRVKKIYLQEEGDIAETMMENGALMLLSLDGKMAVKIQTDQELKQGDTVTVTDEEGEERKGTVESMDENICVITMSDKKISLDETVTVTKGEKELGSGKAYIHQSLAVTGTAGTVTEIAVAENQSISSGDSLYTMVNVNGSLEYQEALARREACAETLQKLIALSQSGEITADRDGTVESVLVSDSQTASAQTTTVTQTASSQKAAVVQTSFSETDSSSEKLMNLTASFVGEVADTVTGEPEKEENVTGTKAQISIVSEDTGEADTLFLKTPVTGEVPQTAVSAAGICSGTVSWTPAGETFEPAVSYQAQVTLTAADDCYFDADSIVKLEMGVLSGVQVSEDGKTMTFSVTFPETEEQTDDETDKQEENSADEQKDNAAGNVENGVNSGNTSNESTAKGNSLNGGGITAAAGNVSGAGGSTGGTVAVSAGGSSESTEEATAESYSTDTAAFTISGNEEMILSVSVDELDINSVEKGQEAEITFDALEDETAVGEVTSVSSTGTVNGGVAKYAVEITIPKTEEMKAGMNASATIVIEEREDAVTIPVSALQERGDQVYVYTETDEDGNLSGEVSVVTGLSDGSIVEITEGLLAGDTVYYQKTGGSSSGQNSGKMEGGMDNGEMPQGGPGNFEGTTGAGGQGGRGDMMPPGN